MGLFGLGCCTGRGGVNYGDGDERKGRTGRRQGKRGIRQGRETEMKVKKGMR